MQTILGALITWPPLLLSAFGSLKPPCLPEDQLIVLTLLLVLLCVAGSIPLALRSRRRRLITDALSLENLQSKSPNSGKAQGLQCSPKLDAHADPNHLDESPKTILTPGWVFVMLMLLVTIFGLLFCGPARCISKIHDGYRAIERSSGQPSDSTTLQEVFQVYQPVPSPPEEVVDCDLNLLLMDHVFSQSYGKPFVGTSEVIRYLTLSRALICILSRCLRATQLHIRCRTNQLNYDLSWQTV